MFPFKGVEAIARNVTNGEDPLEQCAGAIGKSHNGVGVGEMVTLLFFCDFLGVYS